jgi:NAD(P)H-nitrite reductase large subunit
MEVSELKQESNKKGSRTLVKCLVCGEIFDSSLDKCPVCGVGREHFVPYEEAGSNFKNNTKEVFVILGNGAAGISAATAIRERNETCYILMISNESVISYNRPMLTKSLISLSSAEQIAIHDETWYKQNNIANLLDRNIESINTETKEIQLFDRTETATPDAERHLVSIKYDKCIYALGAESFIPPIPGKEKPEVISIRRIADVQKISELLPKVKNVTVIGGGILGLEAAWEISKASCKVTVLEVADKLMGRQVDEGAGKLLEEIIKDTGIDIRLNANISEITGETSVTGVKLASGEFIPADMVLISSGIIPNTALAKNVGITTARGIVVNEKMETSKANIYACGDCAEYKGINYGIWPQALEMGKVAGANAAGDTQIYETVTAVVTFNGMNTTLFAAGDNGKNPNLTYKTVENKDIAQKLYEKYYFVDNLLTGVILIGDTSKVKSMTQALEEKRPFDKMF